MRSKLGFTCLIITIFFFGCKDAVEDNIDDLNNPSTQAGIIVAGSYSTGGNEYGAYWTYYESNGSWERTDLDDARVIHDIAVNGVFMEYCMLCSFANPRFGLMVKKELDTPNKDENW